MNNLNYSVFLIGLTLFSFIWALFSKRSLANRLAFICFGFLTLSLAYFFSNQVTYELISKEPLLVQETESGTLVWLDDSTTQLLNQLPAHQTYVVANHFEAKLIGNLTLEKTTYDVYVEIESSSTSNHIRNLDTLTTYHPLVQQDESYFEETELGYYVNYLEGSELRQAMLPKSTTQVIESNEPIPTFINHSNSFELIIPASTALTH